MPDEPKPSPAVKTNFDEFDSSMQDYLKAFVAAAAVATEGDEDADMIRGTAETFRTQISELFSLARTAYKSANIEARSDVDTFLRVAAASQHAQNGVAALKKTGLICRIIQWLQKHLQELKKIIFAILDLLGIHLGKKVHEIINLIDEIFNIIASWLCPDAAKSLSQNEVQFLTEFHAARRLTLLEQGFNGGSANTD